jgi:hypothetical protein
MKSAGGFLAQEAATSGIPTNLHHGMNGMDGMTAR